MPTNNEHIGVVPSASYTATQTGPDIENRNYRGIKVVVNVTVNTGGLGSITVTIQGKDKTGLVYYTILASAAITAVGTSVLTVYPSLPAVANVSANDVLPDELRVVATANNANPISYSVGATLIA